MAVFVYPVPLHLRGTLLDRPRLYAYPRAPEPVGEQFIILDSGAFELSQKGKKIDAAHMALMASHYRKHGACDDRPVVGVAPDVYLDPMQTLSNWISWWNHHAIPVAPVIQFSEKGSVSTMLSEFQAREFAKQKPRFWCVSNPGLQGHQARLLGIERVFDLLKSKYGATWIHCLGAGWNTDDVKAWKSMRNLDSFDSIAHYTEPGWSDPVPT